MNMSYCRWQNTAQDLADCAASLEEELAAAEEANIRAEVGGEEEDTREVLSHQERMARLQVFETIITMLDLAGIQHEIDSHELSKVLGNV